MEITVLCDHCATVMAGLDPIGIRIRCRRRKLFPDAVSYPSWPDLTQPCTEYRCRRPRREITTAKARGCPGMTSPKWMQETEFSYRDLILIPMASSLAITEEQGDGGH
jgi:hypothetical protein